MCFGACACLSSLLAYLVDAGWEEGRLHAEPRKLGGSGVEVPGVLVGRGGEGGGLLGDGGHRQSGKLIKRFSER